MNCESLRCGRTLRGRWLNRLREMDDDMVLQFELMRELLSVLLVWLETSWYRICFMLAEFLRIFYTEFEILILARAVVGSDELKTDGIL